MKIYRFCTFQTYTPKPAAARHVCACLLLFALQGLVHADNGSLYRAKVLMEVQGQLSNQDKELAEQLVDIRIQQEKRLGIKPLTPTLIPHNAITSNDHSASSTHSLQDQTKNFKENFIYAGRGHRWVLGYAWGKLGNFQFRTDLSGESSTDSNRNINGTLYNHESKGFSLGSYLDWHPFNSPLRLSGGFHINDMKTSLIGKSHGSVAINGHSIALGTNIFNVDFRFPAITPYLGVGYNNISVDSPGFHFFADAGVMIGHYEATATTNVIGSQNVTTADVYTEMNTLRNALFRNGYIPTAHFGVTYRFK